MVRIILLTLLTIFMIFQKHPINNPRFTFLKSKPHASPTQEHSISLPLAQVCMHQKYIPHPRCQLHFAAQSSELKAFSMCLFSSNLSKEHPSLSFLNRISLTTASSATFSLPLLRQHGILSLSTSPRLSLSLRLSMSLSQSPSLSLIVSAAASAPDPAFAKDDDNHADADGDNNENTNTSTLLLTIAQGAEAGARRALRRQGRRFDLAQDVEGRPQGERKSALVNDLSKATRSPHTL